MQNLRMGSCFLESPENIGVIRDSVPRDMHHRVLLITFRYTSIRVQMSLKKNLYRI